MLVRLRLSNIYDVSGTDSSTRGICPDCLSHIHDSQSHSISNRNDSESHGYEPDHHNLPFNRMSDHDDLGLTTGHRYTMTKSYVIFQASSLKDYYFRKDPVQKLRPHE